MIWLVNQSLSGARDVQVRFNGLTQPKTFRQKFIVTSGYFDYACDIQDQGNTFTVDASHPYFDDTIWGQVLQVYVEE